MSETQGRPWPICCPRQDFTLCPLPHISEYKLTWTNNEQYIYNSIYYFLLVLVIDN